MVLSESDERRQYGATRWLCKCDCGTERIVGGNSLKRGTTRSCGCLSREIHSKLLIKKFNNGREKSYFDYSNNLHRIFHSMRARCNNPNERAYYRYGGRGIRCEWENYVAFHKDMYRSYIASLKKNGRKDTTLERINNDGNYCKENCRWATRKEQTNNMSNNLRVEYMGKVINLTKLPELVGISYEKLRYRIFLKGWDINKALTYKRYGK